MSGSATTPLAADVADRLPVGVVVIDPSGVAQYTNPAWIALTATPGAWLDWVSPEEREERLGAILFSASEGRSYTADWKALRSDGVGRRVLRVTAAPEVAGGRLSAIVITATDVTNERAWLAEVLREAAHDKLTGLYNRGRFTTFVAHALDRRRRDPTLHLAVIAVDVDDLKATNDAHGHEAGDRLLKSIAERIVAAVRPGDVVARYGGDEFAVLCEDLHDDVEAEVIADRVRGAVRSGPALREPFSASVGVAAANGHEDLVELMAAADQQMYREKRKRAAPMPLQDVDHLAIAAHELRGPITAIAGHAALVRRGDHGLSADEVQRSIDVIERQAWRLDRTVQDLLRLASLTHEPLPPLTVCDVSLVIDHALEIAPPRPPAVVTIEAPPDQPLQVLTDEPRAVGALVNLLTNAYRHGGPRVTIRARRDGDMLRIDIEDDGSGVDDEALPRLFELFARGGTRSDGQARPSGSGLGLAIAKCGVESLGGWLDHTPVEPHGARFTVHLPAPE